MIELAPTDAPLRMFQCAAGGANGVLPDHPPISGKMPVNARCTPLSQIFS